MLAGLRPLRFAHRLLLRPYHHQHFRYHHETHQVQAPHPQCHFRPPSQRPQASSRLGPLQSPQYIIRYEHPTRDLTTYARETKQRLDNGGTGGGGRVGWVGVEVDDHGRLRTPTPTRMRTRRQRLHHPPNVKTGTTTTLTLLSASPNQPSLPHACLPDAIHPEPTLHIVLVITFTPLPPHWNPTLPLPPPLISPAAFRSSTPGLITTRTTSCFYTTRSPSTPSSLQR
ncbi:hypothetical protein DFP72DRAFT_293802 [Ephemerocybe angulata]|uniref:Uncharacterized protein n=1 Tax=Ephemerocybe angulata TaxID=980116 RepID=A0A8H6I2C7_9AGAR|nr:hypothetical protein DFP72DRAFT_293802 [Tulosesus angulatus]